MRAAPTLQPTGGGGAAGRGDSQAIPPHQAWPEGLQLQIQLLAALSDRGRTACVTGSPHCLPPEEGTNKQSVVMQHSNSSLGQRLFPYAPCTTAQHPAPRGCGPAWPGAPFSWSLPDDHSSLQALPEQLRPNAETQHTAHPPWAATHPQDGASWQADMYLPRPDFSGDWHRLDTARCRRRPGSLLPSCQCCVTRKARSSPATCGVSIGNGTDPGWMGHCCSSPR